MICVVTNGLISRPCATFLWRKSYIRYRIHLQLDSLVTKEKEEKEEEARSPDTPIMLSVRTFASSEDFP